MRLVRAALPESCREVSPNAQKKIEQIEVATDQIESLVHIVRGQRVMLDSDLARLYGVTTKRLNEQVARNCERFPEDFAYQLTHKRLQT